MPPASSSTFTLSGAFSKRRSSALADAPNGHTKPKFGTISGFKSEHGRQGSSSLAELWGNPPPPPPPRSSTMGAGAGHELSDSARQSTELRALAVVGDYFSVSAVEHKVPKENRDSSKVSAAQGRGSLRGLVRMPVELRAELTPLLSRRASQRTQWQPQELVLTIFVATPAEKLTLARRWSEIVDLDQRVSSCCRCRCLFPFELAL